MQERMEYWTVRNILWLRQDQSQVLQRQDLRSQDKILQVPFQHECGIHKYQFRPSYCLNGQNKYIQKYSEHAVLQEQGIGNVIHW